MHKQRAGRSIEASSHRLSTSAFERGWWDISGKGRDPASSSQGGRETKVFLGVLCALCGKTVFFSGRWKDSYSLPVLSSPGTWPSNNSLVLSAAR